MKFLILGASGMAGHTISIYLKEKGYDVIGFARRELSYIDTIIGDVSDFGKLREIIKNGKYDFIVNAIGILNKAAEDNKSEAVKLNSYLPHYLSDVTKDMKTQIIHMSTDCVFSGKKGLYTEDSFKDGETFYDRSKALGELNDNKNLTLRNSIIGPDINEKGIGLFNWFMKQEGIIKGFDKVMWTGMTTLQLAKVIELIAINGATGLYNMVPKNNISKYDLLILFNKYAKNNKVKIEPYSDIKSDKTLIRTKYDFKFEVPDYDIMIKEMVEWINNHKELYPHYILN